MEDPIVPPVTPTEPVEPVAPVEAPVEPGETPVEPGTTPQPQFTETEKKLYARAKKAEAELKALRGGQSPAPAAAVPQATPQANVEETVLLANGMPEELMTKLKSVAKVEGYSSLLKAQNDPIFVAVKEKFEKEKKQKEAELRGSRGAGAAQAPRSLNTPGLSRDEHFQMVKALGQ